MDGGGQPVGRVVRGAVAVLFELAVAGAWRERMIHMAEGCSVAEWAVGR